jgi:hypothetical protein
MSRLNRTRTDYLEKFEDLIEADKGGSRNIDEIFRDLLPDGGSDRSAAAALAGASDRVLDWRKRLSVRAQMSVATSREFNRSNR